MIANKENLDLSEKRNICHTDETKIHPWRVCPIGKHFVHTHQEHIPPSKTHPEGEIITRHQHCAENPSKKDLLSFDEIQEISKIHFSNLSGPPNKFPSNSEFFKTGNKFDNYIRGWVRYWNDIFNPEDPLDANLVKALIATESSFIETTDFQTKKLGHVRGLMQITGNTFPILCDHHGELRNFLFDIKAHDLLDPSINICVGIRWLFWKKELAKAKLKRDATWIEAIAAYKSYLGKVPEPDAMKKLRKYHSELQDNKE